MCRAGHQSPFLTIQALIALLSRSSISAAGSRGVFHFAGVPTTVCWGGGDTMGSCAGPCHTPSNTLFLHRVLVSCCTSYPHVSSKPSHPHSEVLFKEVNSAYADQEARKHRRIADNPHRLHTSSLLIIRLIRTICVMPLHALAKCRM